jgi:hypothetical protein
LPWHEEKQRPHALQQRIAQRDRLAIMLVRAIIASLHDHEEYPSWRL